MTIAKYGLRLATGCLPLMLGALAFTSVQAQESPEEPEDLEGEVEEITVTGSRISRDEFSSPSPIQVLDVESGRQLGISSITEMLQRATVANGTQIDATLNTNAGNSNATEAPPTGGVGSSSIDLRGLGPERTLILVNGRRMGSVGVRGAPAQPDINLIPFSMVDRVEVLTEGVSAVYGADAVAGVVNVILRDDFEGFEITLNSEIPNEDGGDVSQISMLAGAQSDRASIIFGAEYYDRQRVRVGEREFSRCLRDIEIATTGEILSTCYETFFDNVVLAPGNGGPAGDIWAFYTPGETNMGIPNFSDWFALPDPTTLNPANGNQGDFSNFGYLDFYNDQDDRRRSDLVGELERTSLVTTGRIDMDWWANEEIFFEAYYLNSRTFSIASPEQIFPDIPALIPQVDVNGNIIVSDTDQFWATDQLNEETGTCNPNAADDFAPGQNIPASAFPCAGALQVAAGSPILVDNPLNPFGVNAAPIMTLQDLPQNRDVERELMRFVGGLRGDFGDSSWSYEGFFSYDRGIGFQAQKILFEPHLRLATFSTRLDADGNVICGLENPTGGLAGFDTPSACVPLDIFGLNSGGATFDGGQSGEGVLSEAERTYLLGNRTNRTVVEQRMFSAFATGDLFEIGDRTVAAAIGAEYRTDTINSQNDITGVQGLNAAENPLQEGETIGQRDVMEVFGEINVPLLDSVFMDAAVRYTDEENFGEETTWRARLAWSPLDYMTLSASAGTSYRAPNLREQFLADQGGGIGGGSDPCILANIAPLDPADPATQQLIGRCIASGVAFTDSDGDGNPDTTVLGSQGVTTIPISTGGNSNLVAETSDSYTATVQFTQPWSNDFDFDVALSYWSIEIQDTVEEPEADFIIDECFTNNSLPDFDSNPFCGLLSRPNIPGGNPASNIINFVDVSFINIGEDTAKGLDLNTRLLMSAFGLDVAWATATTRQLERENQPFGPETREDLLGTIGVPELKFTSTLSLRLDQWELLMQNRFMGDGQQNDTDPDAVNVTHAAGLAGVASHDVDFVDSIWYTDLSLNYLFDDSWSFTLGVNNVFDEEPPLIDSNEGPNENNAVSSAGYDFFGRTIFATVSAAF